MHILIFRVSAQAVFAVNPMKRDVGWVLKCAAVWARVHALLYSRDWEKRSAHSAGRTGKSVQNEDETGRASTYIRKHA